MPEAIETMTCEAALAALEPYLDGELDRRERERLEAHLGACAGCAEERELALAIGRELRALPRLDCPAPVLARVRREVERERGARPWAGARPRPGEPGRRSRLRPMLAAAALLAALGAAFLARDLGGPAAAPPAASPQEVARATAEARFALEFVGRAGRRTGLDLRDDVLGRHLVAPVARTLRGALAPAASAVAAEDRKGT